MATEGQPSAPSAFGRYTLLERLAVGGMAEVFRAKITSSHGFEKILVVKRILPHLAADPNFVSMFIDEAKLTAQLTHPKIVQVLDFGEVRGQYFTALEYIDGFDALGLLRVAAQKRVHVPRPLAVFIVSDVLEALDYAHNARDMEGKAMQIVHRDISPSNIFISKRGDVKLGDFGIAHAQRRESKTQAGTLKGKYGYMSPEQVVGKPIDARSDLFAVGVVLAELLTGRRLFSAPADLDVLLKVRDVKLDRLDKYGADLPKPLDKIVRRSLRKQPRDRFASAAEFRDELADYLFSIGQRIGPADLRAFTGTLFDTSPDAAARLLQEARRMETPKAAAKAGAEQATAGGPGGRAFPAAASGGSAGARATGPQVPTRVSDLVSDAPTAETAAGVSPGSWPEEGSDRSSAPGFTPVSRPGEPSRAIPPARSRTGGRPATHSDVGKFVSAAPKRPPDSAGDVSIITPMRLFCDLALAGETGLLHFELGATVKEIFLVGGAPESVSSSNANERFGEYLLGKQVLGPADLELALSMLPHYNGKLGDTLVALGLLRPLDVFRLLSEQVRDRVIDVFGWTEGTFAFYRGVTNRQENFPLGLDTFEILGASVVSLGYEQLVQRFDPMLDYRPVATGRGRVEPETFRIGPTPRDVLNLLDGERTLRDWMNQFTDREELLTFLRSLYLLVETDLAELD
ncbi:MAG TPA: protein kinase [Polyangia bacterium]|nr:protein kinase [Polyangia bacterium]